MTKPYIIFARYNAEANSKIIEILRNLPHAEREKERGSFYGSLSGIVRHILGGSCYISGLFTKALSGNAAASDALAVIAAVPHAPEGVLTDEQWQETATSIGAADSGYIALTKALRNDDLDLPIKLDWYGGKPDAVPLWFMLQQLTAHHTHHRGQISQIFDELKIDNDYSGMSPSLL
ncbi:MAG: damage-inducible protein DinB [Spirochaetaceae bacterium]|jgi:uncharacterized damage-inducible protein DinB|nr:damage-inducible protein DinB [Spirochaetaceae bacterium]